MRRTADSIDRGEVLVRGLLTAGASGIGLLLTITGVARSSVTITAVGSLFLLGALLVWSRNEPQPAAEAAETTSIDAEAKAPVRVPPTLEADVVVRTLYENVNSAFSANSAHLWLEDPSTGSLRLVASAGPMSPADAPVSVEGDQLGETLTRGQATLASAARVRVGDDARTVWRFALPVSTGAARGVAAVDVTSAEPPSGDELAALTAPLRGPLAGALALHVARFDTHIARELLETARDLSRALDPDEVLRVTLKRAMSLSSAATGSIMLLDDASGLMRIVLSEGLPEDIVETTSVSTGEGISGWVLATSQPVLIEDLPTAGDRAGRRGVRSAVCVPLADEDGILGVVNIGSREFPARFTDAHMHALETLGKQAAVALRNAWAVRASRDMHFETLRALVLALETKDPYAAGGTERVLEYAVGIGRLFGLAQPAMSALRTAALLHDLGMSALGDGVLDGRRPLSTVERGLLKLHPALAAELLDEAPALREVVPIVYHHHEWYDGEGYADGISGEDIPLGARILSVVDAYVAMTSPRPYRRPMSVNEAVGELERKAGTQFDPAVVEVFVDLLRAESERIPDK